MRIRTFSLDIHEGVLEGHFGSDWEMESDTACELLDILRFMNFITRK